MKRQLRKNPNTPIMISVPHSGQLYPKIFLDYKNINLNDLKVMEDYQCNKILDKVNPKHADMILAECPRTVVDLNRSRHSIDETMFIKNFIKKPQTETLMVNSGLGVFPKKCYNKEIFNIKLPEEYAISLLRKYYDPYHNLISKNLYNLKTSFGYAILIDIHSMPSKSFENKNGPIDIVIGDNFGKSCSSKIRNYIINFFKQNNLNVSLNTPYAGGYITRNYGKKKFGYHAVQIEINKQLYMDENNYELNANLEKLQQTFSELFNEFLNLQKIAAE